MIEPVNTVVLCTLAVVSGQFTLISRPEHKLKTQQRAERKSIVQSRSSGYVKSSKELKEHELCIYWVSVSVYCIQVEYRGCLLLCGRADLGVPA